MTCKTALLACAAAGCLSLGAAADAALVTVVMEDFVGASPAPQFHGQSISYDGFILSSLLDGAPGSQIAIAGNGQVADGLGVGQPTADGPSIGFTRSINNNGANAESIDPAVAAAAGSGLYQHLTAVSVTNMNNGEIVIAGFADDPQATVTDGTASYAAGTLTWSGVAVAAVQTASFANPAATPIGTTLNLSNGSTAGTANQYGLRSFTYMAVPEPSTGMLAAVAGLGVAFAARRRAVA